MELSQDLPRFYSEMEAKAAIGYATAQRYVQIFKGLKGPSGDAALEALDALKVPATIDQCVLVSKQTPEVQIEVARKLAGQRSCTRVLRELRKASRKESEHDFQTRVIKALQKRYGLGIYLERRNVGRVVTRDRSGKEVGVFSASRVVGAADYFGIIGGCHVEIEFKKDGGKRSKEQEAFEARMDELGADYFLFSAADGLDACLEHFALEYPVEKFARVRTVAAPPSPPASGVLLTA